MIVEPSPDRVTWLDGNFVPWCDAKMHISDHHYGFGVFEGVRSYALERSAAIFRLRDHTDRLFRSAHILGVPIPSQYDRARINEAQVELLRRNKLGNAYLRPFIFYGGALGLSPRSQGLEVHVSIMALEWKDGAYRRGDATQQGLSLRTSTFTRYHANSQFRRAKANANYMNSMLALQEAQSSGADDALLLDGSGYVTETSAANVFVVEGGTLYSPPRESALDGITRDTVTKLAAIAGIAVAERRLSRDDFYAADEAFVTGTAVEVTPIRELDGRRIGPGTRGRLTERLQSMYAAYVRGRGETDLGWLTPV